MGPTKLILWTGKKHSGKTTSVFKLANIVRKEGFTVAGLLAFSIYENGEFFGLDAFDLESGRLAPLARCREKESEKSMYLAPQFIAGLNLGRVSLSPAATQSADLIIIDEFGPLELDQRGWRKDVELLLASSDAIILLIVRSGLVETVKKLYKDVPSIEIIASEQDSVDRVVALLKKHQQKDLSAISTTGGAD